MPNVDEEWVTVTDGPTGGAGWVFGDAQTHDRLARELVVGAGAAVVFPDYSRWPEARYPVAIEQNYATAPRLAGARLARVHA